MMEETDRLEQDTGIFMDRPSEIVAEPHLDFV